MEGKPQENNPWSSLSTVTTFDNGSHTWTTRRVDETEVQGSGQIVGRVAPSTSLLIESLIQQLCTMFEGDAMRRNKLYYAICDRLYEMKLIDGSYNKMEFEAMRGQYQVALYKLVAVARALTGSESTLKVPNGLMAEWSRYRREFIELEFVATGGFGSVFKARHRLDGSVYAIKKIAVRSGRVSTIMKHLEEVKTIARLNHTNIVSYKGAWIEQSFPVTFVRRVEAYDARRASEKKRSPSPSLRDGGRGVGDDRARADSTGDRQSHGMSESVEVCHRSDSEDERSENDDDDDDEKYEDEEDDYDDDGYGDDDDYDDDDEDKPRNIAYKTGMYTCNSPIGGSVNFDDDVRDVNVSGAYVVSHDIVNERFQQLNSATNLIGRRISERVSSRIKAGKNERVEEEPEETSDVVSFRSETRDSDDACEDNGNVSPVPLNTRAKPIDCTEYPDESESIEENSDGDKRQLCKFDPTAPQRYAILYIQMALCDQTLRQWLDERQEPTPVRTVTAILTQILSGLEYIHSLDIVHHDIKPSNIFVSKSGNMQIQLGDFGLACPLQRVGRHSVHGTPTYAAPEQLNGICDPKSDVYSLGIVLLELLIPMRTCMERSRVIAALKNGQLPHTLTANYPQWAQIIRQLVQDNPKKRSSPKELLKYLSEDKDSIIAALREDNVRKDDLIQQLRNRIEQLEATIARHKIDLDAD